MADVTYNSAIFPSLVRTLVSLLSPPTPPSTNVPADLDLASLSLSPPSTPSALVLLSFKERDPTGAERNLWKLAEAAGIWFERVGGVEGHGVSKEEGEVEVWVGGLGGR